MQNMDAHLQLIANRVIKMLKVRKVSVARNDSQIFKCFAMSKVLLQTPHFISLLYFCFKIYIFLSEHAIHNFQNMYHLSTLNILLPPPICNTPVFTRRTVFKA